MPTTGILYNGTDIGSFFAAKGAGTAAVTGIKSNGTDLNQLLLIRSAGVDIGFNTGIMSNGNDLRNIFGAASAGLPINGGTYSATVSGAPGSGQVVMTMDNSGNYSVVRNLRGSPTTLASGSWITSYGAGGSVSDYTIQYLASVVINQQVGGGDFTNINGASSQVSLSTTRTYTADSNAYFSGDSARQTVTLTIRVWKLGVQQQDTIVTFNTNATAA